MSPQYRKPTCVGLLASREAKYNAEMYKMHNKRRKKNRRLEEQELIDALGTDPQSMLNQLLREAEQERSYKKEHPKQTISQVWISPFSANQKRPPREVKPRSTSPHRTPEPMEHSTQGHLSEQEEQTFLKRVICGDNDRDVPPEPRVREDSRKSKIFEDKDNMYDHRNSSTLHKIKVDEEKPERLYSRAGAEHRLEEKRKKFLDRQKKRQENIQQMQKIFTTMVTTLNDIKTGVGDLKVKQGKFFDNVVRSGKANNIDSEKLNDVKSKTTLRTSNDSSYSWFSRKSSPNTSTKPTPNASTKLTPNASTKPTPNQSTKTTPNMSNKPTPDVSAHCRSSNWKVDPNRNPTSNTCTIPDEYPNKNNNVNFTVMPVSVIPLQRVDVLYPVQDYESKFAGTAEPLHVQAFHPFERPKEVSTGPSPKPTSVFPLLPSYDINKYDVTLPKLNSSNSVNTYKKKSYVRFSFPIQDKYSEPVKMCDEPDALRFPNIPCTVVKKPADDRNVSSIVDISSAPHTISPPRAIKLPRAQAPPNVFQRLFTNNDLTKLKETSKDISVDIPKRPVKKGFAAANLKQSVEDNKYLISNIPYNTIKLYNFLDDDVYNIQPKEGNLSTATAKVFSYSDNTGMGYSNNHKQSKRSSELQAQFAKMYSNKDEHIPKVDDKVNKLYVKAGFKEQEKIRKENKKLLKDSNAKTSKLSFLYTKRHHKSVKHQRKPSLLSSSIPAHFSTFTNNTQFGSELLNDNPAGLRSIKYSNSFLKLVTNAVDKKKSIGNGKTDYAIPKWPSYQLTIPPIKQKQEDKSVNTELPNAIQALQSYKVDRAQQYIMVPPVWTKSVYKKNQGTLTGMMDPDDVGYLPDDVTTKYLEKSNNKQENVQKILTNDQEETSKSVQTSPETSSELIKMKPIVFIDENANVNLHKMYETTIVKPYTFGANTKSKPTSPETLAKPYTFNNKNFIDKSSSPKILDTKNSKSNTFNNSIKFYKSSSPTILDSKNTKLNTFNNMNSIDKNSSPKILDTKNTKPYTFINMNYIDKSSSPKILDTKNTKPYTFINMNTIDKSSPSKILDTKNNKQYTFNNLNYIDKSSSSKILIPKKKPCLNTFICMDTTDKNSSHKIFTTKTTPCTIKTDAETLGRAKLKPYTFIANDAYKDIKILQTTNTKPNTIKMDAKNQAQSIETANIKPFTFIKMDTNNKINSSKNLDTTEKKSYIFIKMDAKNKHSSSKIVDTTETKPCIYDKMDATKSNSSSKIVDTAETKPCIFNKTNNNNAPKIRHETKTKLNNINMNVKNESKTLETANIKPYMLISMDAGVIFDSKSKIRAHPRFISNVKSKPPSQHVGPIKQNLPAPLSAVDKGVSEAKPKDQDASDVTSEVIRPSKPMMDFQSPILKNWRIKEKDSFEVRRTFNNGNAKEISLGKNVPRPEKSPIRSALVSELLMSEKKEQNTSPTSKLASDGSLDDVVVWPKIVKGEQQSFHYWNKAGSTGESISRTMPKSKRGGDQILFQQILVDKLTQYKNSLKPAKDSA